MSATDVQVLRESAWPTLAASVVVWVIAALVVGRDGLLGAVIGTALVFAVCGIGLWVILRVRQHNAQALLTTALATYLVTILALFALLALFKDTTAFSTKAFGWSIIVGVLVWTAAEVRSFGRLQILYVDPTAAAEAEAEGRANATRPEAP